MVTTKYTSTHSHGQSLLHQPGGPTAAVADIVVLAMHGLESEKVAKLIAFQSHSRTRVDDAMYSISTVAREHQQKE